LGRRKCRAQSAAAIIVLSIQIRRRASRLPSTTLSEILLFGYAMYLTAREAEVAKELVTSHTLLLRSQ
jgi:hypothetical protein